MKNICVRFKKGESELIEKYAIFNGFEYSKKWYAYKVRASFHGSHTKEEWLEMARFFGFVCCKCECKVIGGVPTKDHIYPISLGGINSLRNIQPLCRQCNTSKIDFCKRNNLAMPEKYKING